MKSNHHYTTIGKAAEINQDKKIYGTFAEIGAGQETARFFFQAGQASQTIAKTISAYDMVYSDEIYGKESNGRYVCESRLLKMLDKEYSLLIRRLTKTRGGQSTFFAFANTVATGGSSTQRFVHGWIGVRFQTTEGAPHNDIVIHIRMLDKHRLLQQEVLGVAGVNLVHCAFHCLKDSKKFIDGLVDNIKPGQISIDMIRFTGPDVEHFNNHLVNLELVKRNLTDAVLFTPDSSIANISDTLYGKSIIVERGNFRPITNSHLETMQLAENQFHKDFTSNSKKIVTLFEMTMHSLKEGDRINEQDFLDRVRSLAATGHHVLVSNFMYYYKLKQYLRQYTQEPTVVLIGAGVLDRLFDSAHYTDLEGGILEGLGKLFDEKTHLYVYPSRIGKQIINAKNFNPKASLDSIYKFFQQHLWLKDIESISELPEFISSDKIITLMKNKDKSWEKLVPKEVAQLIKSEQLFGYKSF
jgi:nicotinic acid mononucleotide adenylyltransferase